MYIINIGTYLPRECGIATFSANLLRQLKTQGHRAEAVAVSAGAEACVYPPEVQFELRQDRAVDYVKTAESINRRQPDMVLIQHEYGIYGGDCGEFILLLASRLRVPYAVVTHTVLTSPTAQQQQVLRQLTEKAAGVISMNRGSLAVLRQTYGVPAAKCHFIPHGVPLFPKVNIAACKRALQLEGRRIVSTFGLIGPGKGLELGLKAFHQVARSRPDCCWLILGETHPMLKQREGEAYRRRLQQQVAALNLTSQVQFVNHFLTLEELSRYMAVTDVYFSPYPNPEQSVSGTMAYAIGCGRAIVSTPYAYAVENLSGGFGLLSRSPDAGELGELLAGVLDDTRLRAILQNRAAALGSTWQWPRVAQQYVRCLEAALRDASAMEKGVVYYDA